jgi:DNA-binding MarR family transcriptional regulator
MNRREGDRRLIGELLRNPNAARERHVERGLAAAGHGAVRAPHLTVFMYVDRDAGSRVTDLARHGNVSPQAMSEVVAYLERHGYVERVPDPLDGRARRVRLTARGHELYTFAGSLVAELEAAWAARIGERRMRLLKRLLGDLWDSVAPDGR